MVGKVAEIRDVIGRNATALGQEISRLYDNGCSNKVEKEKDWRETRDYIFATDTRTTSNKALPWKNSTTLPKLCQIRDNLHANYMATLYPNDEWLTWVAEGEDGLDPEKARAIKTYVNNKLLQDNFRDTLSQLVYDYIDYGNVFAYVEYVNESYEADDGERRSIYVGPRIRRVSPFDVVIDPSAPSFESAPKFRRSLLTPGEVRKLIDDNPDDANWAPEALDHALERRQAAHTFRNSDINKALAYKVDGFGTYADYLDSGYIEVLQFEGNVYDADNDMYLSNHRITVVDRDFVLRKEPIPSWLGKSSMCHTVWRGRPDNLWGMGPLDNLIGMQYRIDHLENIKADFYDLTAHPPLVIKGNVEEFDWEPFAEILVGDDGDVSALQLPSTVFQADTQIAQLMNYMEEFAGAPRQAIGQRTPGEKTAFEVQTLENNANKMFQEKTLNFEMFLERLLVHFVEYARRFLDGEDLVAVMDDDLGVTSFINITKEDLSINGKIRPMGARNFAKRAQQIQNYMGLRNVVGNDPSVMNHISGKKEAQFLETNLNLEKFELYQPNVRVAENLETQQLVQTANQQLQQTAAISPDETVEDIDEAGGLEQ